MWLSLKIKKNIFKFLSPLRGLFRLRNMQRLILSLSLLFCLVSAVNAQVYFEEEPAPEEKEEVNENSLSHLSFWERSYFGGNLALSFGTNTYIDVSPLWGYMINRNLSMGLGGTYIYTSREYFDPFSGQTFKYKGSLYGGRGFLRYRVFDNIYFHSEYEAINNEVQNINGDFQREWVPGFFVGGGVFQPAFGRGGVSLFIMYNVIHDDFRSPYGSPWVIRAGFTL